MRKITKVPNGPLIKKKGQFKGSTLKSGGKIKKAQNGDTLSVKKPTWQQMTQPQRAAKKAELIKQGGFERFQKYKDSISTDATNKREADFAKSAAIRGMTVDEYRKHIKKNARKPDAQLPGLEIDKACKRGKTTGSCSTGESNRGESLRDTKRNGGKVMKNGGKTPAWQRKEGKNPSGGLNAKGRASYNRETGGNLKAPQPQGGSRKKSFCARMSGMKKKLTSSKTANNPNSRINKSLRKWKC
jgi:hypothetical protein